MPTLPNFGVTPPSGFRSPARDESAGVLDLTIEEGVYLRATLDTILADNHHPPHPDPATRAAMAEMEHALVRVQAKLKALPLPGPTQYGP